MSRIAHIFSIFVAVAFVWAFGSSGALSQSLDDYQRAMVIYGAKNYEAAIPLLLKLPSLAMCALPTTWPCVINI